MRNFFISVLLGIMIISNAIAKGVEKDTTYWKSKFSIGAGINQANFSSNWKAGGVNSLAISSVFSGKVDYLKEKISFQNEMQLQYGRLYNQNEASYLPNYRKTQDRIFVDSKFGYEVAGKWYVFASLNFQSQFDDGYKYGKDTANNETAVLTSRFFAPAFITESMGIEYKPVSYFSVRAGVGTMRQTIVNDKKLYLTEPNNYGVRPGKTLRNEVAFMLIMNFDKDIAKNMNLKVRYQGFANYQTMDRIDHRVDAGLTAKINKFVNVTLTGVALYDLDQDKKVQFSQAMSLGFLYNF